MQIKQFYNRDSGSGSAGADSDTPTRTSSRPDSDAGRCGPLSVTSGPGSGLGPGSALRIRGSAPRLANREPELGAGPRHQWAAPGALPAGSSAPAECQ
jgi:hypothetical protein